jgi:hypothetical protein
MDRSALRRTSLYGFCCKLACVVLPAHSRKSLRPHTTGELRERKEITDAIVANLRFIAEHVYDLGELERRHGRGDQCSVAIHNIGFALKVSG